MGCHFLLQGILPTQGSNLSLLLCRQILYYLSYRGILSTVYVPFLSCYLPCLLIVLVSPLAVSSLGSRLTMMSLALGPTVSGRRE